MDARLAGILNDLLAFDLDAVAAYEAALGRISREGLHERLRAIADTHRRHADELSACVTRLGGTPVRAPDGKGVLMAGFARFTSVFGPEAALRAIQAAEKRTRAAYEDARHEPWTMGERSAIEHHLRDHEEHLAFVEGALHARAWEGDEGASP